MATNLKRGKKIRAFCYRMLCAGSAAVFLAGIAVGRDALSALFQNEKILSGEFIHLPAFAEYMDTLYNNAMLGYAGVGDDNGYPLTDPGAVSIAKQAKENFLDAVSQGDIVYAVELHNTIIDPERPIDPSVPDVQFSSNMDAPIFSEYDGHLLLPEDILLCYYWNGPQQSRSIDNDLIRAGAGDTDRQYLPNQEVAQNLRLIIGIRTSQPYQSAVMRRFDRTAKGFQAILLTIFFSGLFTLVFLILSLFTVKAAAEAKQKYAALLRKVWLEAKLLILGAALYYFLWNVYSGRLFFDITPYSAFWLAGLMFPAGCLLYLVCTDLNRNRAKVFSNSIPVRLFLYGKEMVSSVPWYRRVMLLCAAVLAGACILSLLGVFLLLAMASVLPLTETHGTIMCIVLILSGLGLLAAFIRLRHFTKDTKILADELSRSRLGEPARPLALSKHSLLTKTAEDIERLENGMEIAIEQQNRSNRMRVELITNVSHDLKTPLTSIINYADLLCEEELPPNAAVYASALQKKAYRLKDMVQEVFDLSKATSGNLPVEKHPLDLVKLIRQTLADMDERIQASGLTFKVTAAAEPIIIEADGEKLYRVFQNLIVNTLQYSLEHSRVHIQLSTEDGAAYARVKNVSRYELDFDTREIMERFVRADASRTSEGSGLGLSIAQSFTEACGGSFSITTDADMFTACVMFPLSQACVLPAEAPAALPESPSPETDAPPKV